VHSLCRATDPAALPVKKNRTTLTAVTERVFFCESAAGVLLEQETGKRRTGLWKLPALPEGTSTAVLLKANYGITRYKVTLWVHASPPPSEPWPATHRRVSRAELATTAMPSPYRRALDTLLRDSEFQLI
jgi:A/G-specific adenine glycosylase